MDRKSNNRDLMDFSKLNTKQMFALLNYDDDKMDDVDENDLEDELESILSGKPHAAKVAKPPPPPPPPSRRPRDKTRANPANSTKQQSSLPINDSSFNIMQVEKMLNNFDANTLSDDDNLDDDDLMSELDHIVKSSNTAAAQKDDVVVASNEIAVPSASRPSFVSQPIKPNVSSLPMVPTKIVQERAAAPPVIDEKNQNITKIKLLQVEYKKVALKAKSAGDMQSAMSHLKVSKQLDLMIKQLEEDQQIDMSALPPSPQEMTEQKPTSSSANVDNPLFATEVSMFDNTTSFENIEVNQQDASKIFNAPQAASSILEALQQRLEKFKSTQGQAESEQNISKARRLGRIVKQYETAIKDHKKGKEINYDELPCPPGFPPIPTQTNAEPSTSQSKPETIQSVVKQERSDPERNVAKQPPPLPPNKPALNAVAQPRPPLKRGISTTGSKQLKFLLERQRLFREAALEAKKRGELEQAKEYLRHAKGFDPLVEATKSGLPIDATTIPVPPQLADEDFVVVHSSDAIEKMDTSKQNAVFYTDIEREELFRQVEKELIDQIEMCNRNKEYFLKMGDINTSNKFEKYAKESLKDRSMLLVRWRNGDNIPSYRTETRTFSIVVSNHEVGINELQVDILKGFDLSDKPEIDTFVRVELPIPSEKPQIKKTKTVYNSINPEFKESFKFEIDRKSRSLPRLLKRHPLKLDVFSKGGFLRSDTRLGSIVLKLSDLETKCTIHECISLTEGRKALHGKLEIKVKLREPLLAKQIEEIKEKWIVFA